jgi:hypothetical protein
MQRRSPSTNRREPRREKRDKSVLRDRPEPNSALSPSAAFFAGCIIFSKLSWVDDQSPLIIKRIQDKFNRVEHFFWPTPIIFLVNRRIWPRANKRTRYWADALLAKTKEFLSRPERK